jgi:HSP20 family protein
MAIQRSDPLRDMHLLQERMNRLFEEALTRSSTPTGSELVSSAAWRPPTDLFEESGRYVLRADLPGVEPSEVELQVQHGQLILRGERRRDDDVAREAYLRVERPDGRFSIQVALPPSVDQHGIAASQRNGVLEVVLPKRRQETPGRIEIVTSA